MTGTFLKLWVSISEAGIKKGHQALREIIHINPGRAQGTGQLFHSSEPGSEKWLQLKDSERLLGSEERSSYLNLEAI